MVFLRKLWRSQLILSLITRWSMHLLPRTVTLRNKYSQDVYWNSLVIPNERAIIAHAKKSKLADPGPGSHFHSNSLIVCTHWRLFPSSMHMRFSKYLLIVCCHILNLNYQCDGMALEGNKVMWDLPHEEIKSFLEVFVSYLKCGLSKSCLAHLSPPCPHTPVSSLSLHGVCGSLPEARRHWHLLSSQNWVKTKLFFLISYPVLSIFL